LWFGLGFFQPTSYAIIGTIGLKLLGFPNFILHDVLYVPKLRWDLLSLVQIQQQCHTIHMFDGQAEIRRSFDNKVSMTGWEDEKLLKSKGTYAGEQFFAHLSHDDEGALLYSLLWHTRFGKINYDSLPMLNKNGVFCFPTIQRNLK
jgi:hypothetical protein